MTGSGSALKVFALVAAGGALGAVARHGVSALALRVFGPGWPHGTLAVNLVGGLAMGLLAGWLAQRASAGGAEVRLFLATGLLGGFTTFSAFSLEMAGMLARRDVLAMGLYAAVSVMGAVAACVAGLALARRLWA